MRPLAPQADLVLLLCLLPTVSEAAASRILLSKVKSLTLYSGKSTSHRRVPAIPQLKCIGGSGKGLYEVDVMQCKNAGSEYDAEDIQWTCTASLPPEFKLGSTDVICEGFQGPDDPWVLKGSCGVQYRLVLTDAGEKKYGKRRGRQSRYEKEEGESVLGDVFTVLFWLAFAAIVLTILSRILGPLLGRDGGGHARRRPGVGDAGGGGGGRPDDPFDPPPPYSPRPSKRRTRDARESSTRSNTSSWRPGFWSGTATGAAAGYAMGNRNANRNQRANERHVGNQAGPSNWFGARGTDEGSYSSNSGSGSRHQSTGFGGTSRR